MIHDESSFDIRAAEGIKVPKGYGNHFNSFDGKAHKFLAESNGGPSWFTEYNVLAGLSSRSFGRFAYFVTRIASSRVERGLPLALRRCGYETLSLYPAFGAFMSARSFQITTGIQHFYDAHDLGAKDVEPDSFFYDKALGLMSQETQGKPLFMFVYLAANHFPWETQFRPDLLPSWRPPGNEPVVDEYLRRQAMSAGDYAGFIAGLKKKFPAQPFLIVRYGDHQPEFSPHLLDPDLDEAGVGKKLDSYDPRYYATYYAIDAVNFEPVEESHGHGDHRRAVSAAGDPGSRRHSARSVIRGAEGDHASLRRNVLCLQERSRSPPLQPPVDRCRPDPRVVDNGSVGWAKARLRCAHHLSDCTPAVGTLALCSPYRFIFLSEALRDVDVLTAVTPGNRHHLRGAARNIGPVGRRHVRRKPMGPVPGNIIGRRVVNVARGRRCAVRQRCAIR